MTTITQIMNISANHANYRAGAMSYAAFVYTPDRISGTLNAGNTGTIATAARISYSSPLPGQCVLRT